MLLAAIVSRHVRWMWLRYGESHTSKEIINTKQILFTPPFLKIRVIAVAC